MLKEFAEYLEQRPAPFIQNVDGINYSDKKLYELDTPAPETLKAGSLNSIVDYINKGVDKDTAFPPLRYIINVLSPTLVELVSETKNDGQRWKRISCEAVIPNIKYGQFLDIELFNIMLQSNFEDSAQRKEVLAIIGNITDGVITEHKSDGISQSVNIKAGIQRVGTARVPNPVLLIPYRTFSEIEQPVSPFVLRLKSNGEGNLPSAALFEADGARWRLEAMNSICKFFAQRLVDSIDAGNVVLLA